MGEVPGRSAQGRFEVRGKPASWIRNGTLKGRALVLLGHGAGAPRSSPFMVAVAAGLVQRGCCALRFHFPYMERRVADGGMRPPDPGAVLLETWRARLGCQAAARK